MGTGTFWVPEIGQADKRRPVDVSAIKPTKNKILKNPKLQNLCCVRRLHADTKKVPDWDL